jgi:DNA repair photolyase
MKIIYEPTGASLEYAPLAANPYQSCSHRCNYCYCPQVLKVDRETFYGKLALKRTWKGDLEADAAQLRSDDREILLSFVGDPYQPAEMELGVTRQAIQILMENGLRFTILTKGGTRAVKDFDLLEAYPKARFGTSLVFTEQKDADEWESGAAPVQDRIEAIREAYRRGIPTWVSLEPVIDPDQALEVIKMLDPVVDHWKVGKLNHHKLPVDWFGFRRDLTALLDSLGASYYRKKSLTELGEVSRRGRTKKRPINPDTQDQIERQRTDALVAALREEIQVLGEKFLHQGVEGWFRREGIDDHLTERKEKALRRLEAVAAAWEAQLSTIMDLDRLNLDIGRLNVAILKEAARETDKPNDPGGEHGIREMFTRSHGKRDSKNRLSREPASP